MYVGYVDDDEETDRNFTIVTRDKLFHVQAKDFTDAEAWVSVLGRTVRGCAGAAGRLRMR